MTDRLAFAEITKLLTNDVHRLWRFNSNANRIGPDTHDGDSNLIADQNPLTGLSG